MIFYFHDVWAVYKLRIKYIQTNSIYVTITTKQPLYFTTPRKISVIYIKTVKKQNVGL